MLVSNNQKIKHEIERKFLIDLANLPKNLEKFTSNLILQGYIEINNDFEDRLRQKGNKFYRTTKGKGDTERPEEEKEITETEFKTLWQKTEGKRVEKTRYEIPYGEYVIELDVYRGNLVGLITAEVEFISREQELKFVPPSWFGEDVTKNPKYKNKNLAKFGIPN